MLYQNSSKGKEKSALLRIGLSRAICKLSIIFSLKSLLSPVKMEKSSKDGKQLQHKRYSWIAVSLLLSVFTFFPVRYTPKVLVPNAPKRNVFVKLPFLGSNSFQIRKKHQKIFSNKLTSCNLKIAFTSPVSVKSFFTFKDKLPKMLTFRTCLQVQAWQQQCYLLWKDQTPF